MSAKGALFDGCILPVWEMQVRLFSHSRSWLSWVIAIHMTACGGGSGNSNSSAALSWDSVTATNVAGYRVYYGTQSGAYLQKSGQGVDAGKVTSFTVTGLEGGSRYYFAVTAYNDLGYESGYSNEGFKDAP